ncbi:MAG: DUF2007 domain-containing protein [Anaerolineales bacterium]|jgi:hypothetical protein|nr:DUF2007 domain-containing protein [Anaerolineales bacterium]
MGEAIVTVGSADGMLEAEILRGLLISAGITVWLSHESAGTVYGMGVGPLAQVDLIVPASQEALARQILEDYRAGRLAEDAEDKPAEGEGPEPV